MQLSFLTTGPAGHLEVNPLYRHAPAPLPLGEPVLLPEPVTGRQLRAYQDEATTAALAALAQGQHPCLTLPTGSGKSLVLAALIERLPRTARLLVVTHRQELVEQDSAELVEFVGEAADYGIYSAGLERRDLTGRVIFGGLQSIYRAMDRLQSKGGAFTHILVDECHRVNVRSVKSTYRTIFEQCPDAQRVGLTATPYRLDSGPIFGGEENWFDVEAYTVGMRTLTPEYLAPLRGIQTAHDIDLTGVRTRGGEYATSDLSQAACQEDIVEGALSDICTLGARRKSWMVFCVDVAHTYLVRDRLREKGISAEAVVGTTDKDTRRDLVEGFRRGDFQALLGCEVFTTGFNVRQVDLIALFYSTKSKCKLVQSLGRGARQAESKKDCVILDFGQNIERHRPLDDCLCEVEQTAEREEKDRKKADAARERALKHARHASGVDPFGDDDPTGGETYQVSRIAYEVKASSRDWSKLMLVATYYTDKGKVKQYLCVEHSGIARQKAMLWFARRDLGAPRSAQGALALAEQFERVPTAIVVKHENGWPRVLLEHFDDPQTDNEPDATA